MATMNLATATSFYAMPREFSAWVAGWVGRFGLSYVLATKPPAFRTTNKVEWDDPTAAERAVASASVLLLDIKPLKVRVKRANDLFSYNHHRLDFDIPVLKGERLTPGSVGSVSKDPVRLKIYRRIARDVLDRTQTGLWLFNPNTGGKGIAKRLRFTTAVADAVKQGLALLPPGGGSITVHVEEPRIATGLERFGFRHDQQMAGASGEARMEERLRRVLDAHGLPCGAVITADGNVVARVGEFAAFANTGLVSALLGPYGSAKGTFAGLAGRPLPQLWRQGDAFAFADLPSAELAVVVLGRGRLPILEKVALARAVQASIRSAFGAVRATERDRSATQEGSMSSANIVGWFDDNWMPTRERAIKDGWDSLSRRDQVLLAVGFLLDSCVGDGVWAIVDGVVDGHDEGLTVRMPEALEEVGLAEAAEHVRSIIRLRAPTGSSRKDKGNRDKALDHWGEIDELFEECVPGGERVMLTRLHDWYHAQPEPAQAGTVPAQDDPATARQGKVKKAPKKKRG